MAEDARHVRCIEAIPDGPNSLNFSFFPDAFCLKLCYSRAHEVLEDVNEATGCKRPPVHNPTAVYKEKQQVEESKQHGAIQWCYYEWGEKAKYENKGPVQWGLRRA
ncbi:hypothetical protein BKA82DRAFT_30108 [Pisolithus tinctorius]|uniref:Uncharacterized protein n=1 Tax=Pisolithus tinctorius Marx 270 TaxID=870435 RepID=A0A0C3NWZ0_PISTI|nr:hypothetical protein BKA82DRAFT_30108 [Pisolithus tinctorius]KIN99840.1 hypothetical protein M404DRAFT_30108 [Pisolithus tinctorius Marx 270]